MPSFRAQGQISVYLDHIFVGLPFNPVVLDTNFDQLIFQATGRPLRISVFEFSQTIPSYISVVVVQLSNHWKKYVKVGVAQHLLRMSGNHTLQQNIL